MFKKKAFTLLEMMCVVAIIAVIFSLSIPTITKTARSYYFTNKAKTIEAWLVYQKKTAILQQREQKLDIDFVNNAITSYTENLKTEYPDFLKNKALISSKYFFGDYVWLQGKNKFDQNYQVIFEPTGGISSIEFYLISAEGKKAKFTSSLSGQILMEFI